MSLHFAVAILISLSCFTGAEEYIKEPKINFDPDGEIPVIEGFGGNVDIPVENDVLVLTRDNFIHVVNTKEVILVEFYAPWCGHCKALTPEYEKAAKFLKLQNIPIAKVDADKETELAKEFLISGFPTLKLFKKGTPVEDYDGPRTSSGFVEYMMKHADPNYTPPPSSVVTLNSGNFSKAVKSEKLILVAFVAPWCKHCKALEPEFEGAATELKGDKIMLAKVDGPENKELADEYGVNGYPTLFVFRNGRKFQFSGQRDQSGMIAYMKEQAKLPSREVTSPLEATNSLARKDATVAAYFTEKGDMYEEFIGAANELRGRLVFLHTFDEATANKLKIKPNNINVIMPEIYHSKYEDKIYRYTKKTGTYKDIVQWLTKKTIPLVGERTKANMGYKYSNRPLVVIYYDVNFDHQYVKATQYVRKIILPVADKFRDFTFAICNEEEFDEEIKSLGLEDSGEDVNAAIFTDKLKYPMEPEDDFEGETLEEFITKFKKGKVKAFLKSQPIPKRQDSPVHVIVANNFDKEVLETKKDVLIEFYAPWCGHCKQLDPVYKKLAKHLAKSNPDVVVGKMDATANDVHPMFKIEGFPTIYFLKANEKDNPIPFSGGDRSLEKLKEFVQEESSIGEIGKDEL
ncbi:unnamed protein product [Meganyctiphanes norvegica]|uniref:Protein disulfide-isomerase n=1 Tax=Meganyctiphanes norvegica TaxID=48144 RepID=A0AAV2SAV2_MEGNR